MKGIIFKSTAKRHFQTRNAFNLLFLALIMLNFTVITPGVGASNEEPSVDFRGVTYELQYLDASANISFISEQQIRNDLSLLQQLNVNYIRTMGTKYGQDQIATIAEEYGMKTATGAWISWNTTDSYQEIDKAVNVSDKSDFLIIGTNVYSRGEVSIDQLSDYLDYAKDKTNTSITTSASWQFWYEHYDIGNKCDIIFVEIDTLVEITDVNDINIGGFLQSTLSSLQAVYVGKEIIFSIGFPSANHSIATENNQKVFYQSLLEKLADSDIKCFIFEAFDVPNRQYYTADGNAGSNWGIFTYNREPKPVISLFNQYFGGSIEISSNGIPGFSIIAVISIGSLVTWAILFGKRKNSR